MAKFKIERNEADTGEYDLLMLARDGMWDWLGTYASRAEANAAMRFEISESLAGETAERRYQQQYAHACGYFD